MNKKSKILLINPWIHDFAASDYWSKPLGLLSIAQFLKKSGFENIHFIDCLNHLPEEKLIPAEFTLPKLQKFGKADYLRKITEKPIIFSEMKRFFRHYGLDRELLLHFLKKVPEPDYIFVTSLATYWYQGCLEVISLMKEIYPAAKIVLGGIYLNLCRDHALKNSENILLAEGNVFLFLSKLLDISTCPEVLILPDYEFIQRLHYIPLLISRGCPFECYYCAARWLDPEFIRYPLVTTFEIIKKYYEKGIRDFVFYDDALLYEPEKGIVPLLNYIINENLEVRLHTPNGVHIRYIDEKLAALLFRAGFKSLRLGYETEEEKYKPFNSYKTSPEQMDRTVKILRNAGFSREEIGIYLLIGLPEQKKEEIIKDIEKIKRYDVNIHLNEYSPIPHTYIFEKFYKNSEIEKEPLWQNNSTLSLRSEEFNQETINFLKALIK